MRFKGILQKKTGSKMLFPLLALLLVFFLDFASASQLRIVAPTTIYQWCVQPYVVMMDTNGIETKSVDTKLFLTGYFTFGSPYTTLSAALLTQTWYANHIPWSFSTTTLQTGIATSWTNWEYLYINSYQAFNASPLVWNDIPIATLYLKAKALASWNLDFYFAGGNWNGDDSNISSGLYEWVVAGSYTQYEDSLTGVTNLAESFDSSTASCTSRPYISSAYYRQTWYISTSTGVQAVWTSVIAWPSYSGTSNRTVWTKWNVTLALTGVSDSWSLAAGLSSWIQLGNVQAFNSSYLSTTNQTPGWYTQYYEVWISGNISTWFVWFDNVIGNTGSTYLTGWQKYTDQFNIDVFWIDRVIPTNTSYFTGYIAGTGMSSGTAYTQYTLSGINFVWGGFHAAWTTADDEYKVISFSGTNSVTADCSNKWYACTTVWYMDYLNSTWYVRSGDNIFKLIHDIYLTTSFSGYVTVMDRAGNTGERYIDVSMDNIVVVSYGFLAYPQSAGSRVPSHLSGMLIKLAIYSWSFDKTQLTNWLVYTWWIKTSSTWYATFTGNFTSWQYSVLAEWVSTLSYLLTWISLSPVWGNINYTTAYTSWFMFGDLNNILTSGDIKYANYNYSAIREQEINVSDLALIVTIWGVWNNDLADPYRYEWSNPKVWVYTWELFVDIPNGNRIALYNDLISLDTNQRYMQYHPYDLDANGQVNINDYGVASSNLNKVWATKDWRIAWVTAATMPF